jgi:hypothetical protein
LLEDEAVRDVGALGDVVDGHLVVGRAPEDLDARFEDRGAARRPLA